MMKPMLRGLWIMVLGFACFAVSDAFVPRRESRSLRQIGAPTTYFTQDLYTIPLALQKSLNRVLPIDFNHDGFMDLIALQNPPDPGPSNPAPILAYTNDGNGHFTESTALVLGDVKATNPCGNAVADFNGDGLVDLFITDNGSERPLEAGRGKKYILFIQKPNGTLVDEAQLRLPALNDTRPFGTDAGDIDGDGDLDLMIMCAGGGFYQLLINDGFGYFHFETERLPDLNPYNPNNCLMFDADNDGDIDIFCGGGGNNLPQAGWLFLNDGTGHFTIAPADAIPPSLGPAVEIEQAFSSDLNGDGFMDLALSCIKNTTIQILFNKGNDTFRDVSSLLNNPNLTDYLGGCLGRRVADVNGDGWPDLLVERNIVGGAFVPRLFMNHAGLQFEDVTSAVWSFHAINQGETPASVFVDIDNDGDLDVVGVYPDANYLNSQFYVLTNRTPYPIPEAPLPYPGATTLRSPVDGAILAVNKISLGWDAVPTAFAYRLQLAKESTFTQILSTREVTTNGWPGTGMAPKTTVYWRVRAINSRGSGPWSSGRYFITAFPVYPPTNAQIQRIAVDYGFFKIFTNRLTWQANSQNSIDITHYRIYRKAKDAAESAWSLFVDLPGSSTTYDDRGLRKDQLFAYRITAVSSQGFESDPVAIGN
jgi:hypothetical protein